MSAIVPVFNLNANDLLKVTSVYNIDAVLPSADDQTKKLPFRAYGNQQQVLVQCYGPYKDLHKNAEIRQGDVFVMGCPKSGLTLAQELVWLLDNNLDYETARNTKLNFRGAFFEAPSFSPEGAHKELRAKLAKENYDYFNFDNILNRPSPRHFKTHLMLNLLPDNLLENAKVVYLARNVKESMVLMYKFEKSCGLLADSVDFKVFANTFIDGLVTWAPYFSHLKEAWSKRHHPNLMFMFYEDIVKNLPDTISKVSKFLGKSYSEDQLEALHHHLKGNKDLVTVQSICRPEYNKSSGDGNAVVIKGCNGLLQAIFDFKVTNLFVPRLYIPIVKGLLRNLGHFGSNSGSWQDHFDEELLKRTDAWIAENLAGTDFRFPIYV